MDCIHCGLCLSQCPTYVENGKEADSPRGRIYLMRALAEGRSQPTPDVTHHLDLCLGCRACETACPSGVQYGHLLEGTRAYLREAAPPPPPAAARNALIEAVLPYPACLEAALLPVRLARRWGILPLLRRVGALKLLGRLGEMEAMLPPLPPMRLRRNFPTRWRARGERQAKVGMITGCVMSVMQTPVNSATARLLVKSGCEVEAPTGQGCCGALHAHVGAMDKARELAKVNISAFEERGLDAVIINAAGCGSALKEYGGWFKGDAEWEARAEQFASQVRDVHEWLAEERFMTRLKTLIAQSSSPQQGSSPSSERAIPPTSNPMRDVAREVVPNVGGALSQQPTNATTAPDANKVAASLGEPTHAATKRAHGTRRCLTYHDACHLCHGQSVRSEPRELLALLPDCDVVPLRETEMCCGSAGTYNVTQPAMADRLLRRKMENVRATGATTVAMGNPGCALQLRAGAQKFGVDVDVKYVVELLDAATGK